ncbi:MAG: hypothetical protein ABIY63_18170 [Fibrobacteria bacterium]
MRNKKQNNIGKVIYLPDTTSPEERLEHAREIWRKNKLLEKCEGFSLIPNGRSGIFYYREGNKFIKISIELSGVEYLDLIIFESKFDQWISIDTMNYEPMTIEESKKI